MFVKARRLFSFKRDLQEIFKKEHSETLFRAFLETKYQFPRQGWSSLKFSLKSKIFDENGQMSEDACGKGDGNNRIFSCLALQIYCKFKHDSYWSR